MKTVYSVLANYSRTYGMKEAQTSWKYSAALNFYRAASENTNLAEFEPALEYTDDSQVYVLDGDFDQGLVDRLGLSVVYRGHLSNVVVAVKPEVHDQAANPCFPVLGSSLN